MVDGVEHLKTLPPEQLQGRPFSITPTIALNAGKLQLLSGQAEQAAATLKLGFADNYADIVSSTTLWDTNWYSSLIARAFELAQQSFTQQDEANKMIHLNIGLDAYNQVASDLQGQPLPSSINLNAGKLQYMAGQVQAAAATLKLALSDDYSDAARWYLAALKKAGAAQDQPVYDKLIAADPAEAAEIDTIVNTQY